MYELGDRSDSFLWRDGSGGGFPGSDGGIFAFVSDGYGATGSTDGSGVWCPEKNRPELTAVSMSSVVF